MRRKKKGISQAIKTIPLAVAMAALSAGTLTASALSTANIQITTPDGKILQYNLNGVDSAVEARMKAQLKAAFEGGESIKVATDNGSGAEIWIEFSENAAKEELGAMLADPTNSDWATPVVPPDFIY